MFMEPNDRLYVVKKRPSRLRNTQPCEYVQRRKMYMDTNTLLIIIVLVLLLGGGGWYGRGRWF
jgi:hypothetical protein